MKIEEGKYYKTRDGRKVGPMCVPPKNNTWSSIVKSDAVVDGVPKGWCDGGRYKSCSVVDDLDIIAEAIDVYTIPTMPFGLLTPDQQQALRDHDGVIEYFGTGGWREADPGWLAAISYRAKPKPALVPDTVPWDVIAPKYVKYSRNSDGSCWVENCSGQGRRIDGFLSGHSIGNMRAADAYQFRPGYKP